MSGGEAFPAALRTDLPEIVWPPLQTASAPLAALLHQLAHTERLPPAEIAAGQRRQLAALARHAAAQSPHFRRRLAGAGLQAQDLAAEGALRRLPPLRRREVQTAGAELHCAEVPARHRPVHETRTSGSTGEPVVVRRSELTRLYWSALTLRDHLWHRRDFKESLSIIRAGIAAPALRPDWGPPAALLFETGPRQGIPIVTDIREQARLLADFVPGYLLIYPSNLEALVRHCRAAGLGLPRLRQIRTIGETLSPRVRAEAEAFFGVELADTYSSQEVGIIALQCRESGLYHVMAENLILEVLDDEGRPAAEGEAGRVVVTDLHNFATPLVRYDIGDFAEPAGPCPCGRGLPTLRRILGRERNLLLKPDGSRHWPLVGFARFREVAPVTQYQFIQHAPEALEARLVTETPLTPAQEEALCGVVREALAYPFEIRFTYFPDEIPRSKAGKFEEFVCLVS